MGIFDSFKKKRPKETTSIKRKIPPGREPADRAVLEYREAPRIEPNDALGHYSRGAIYQLQGKLDEAIAEYREALRIDPNLGNIIHSNLGSAYVIQGKFREAIECYQAFIEVALPEEASLVKKVEEIIRELKQRI